MLRVARLPCVLCFASGRRPLELCSPVAALSCLRLLGHLIALLRLTTHLCCLIEEFRRVGACTAVLWLPVSLSGVVRFLDVDAISRCPP